MIGVLNQSDGAKIMPKMQEKLLKAHSNFRS